MKTKTIITLIAFLCVYTLNAQYEFRTNTAHNTITRAIEVSNDVIKGRSLEFEKKAASKPLMFINTVKKISQLNRVANNLSYHIEKLQGEVNTERVLYDLLDEDYYNHILFSKKDGSLTSAGEKLKTKIDSLYMIGDKINIHDYTHLTDYTHEHFDTSEQYYDENEKEIDYFEHLFYDRSNYGMMMAMNCLLLDVKTFQLLYFGTIMLY